MGFFIRHLMAYPEIYSNITLLLRGKKKTQSFVDHYIRPKKGDKVLDIGCGTGDILFFLPDVDYYGFDLDSSYIEMAKQRFGKRGKFFCRMVSRDAVQGAAL
jgi:ubiquinone/menaquinone biosynthesis C-methylase UbiE